MWSLLVKRDQNNARISLLARDVYSVLHAFDLQEAVVNFGGFSGSLSLSNMWDGLFPEQQVKTGTYFSRFGSFQPPSPVLSQHAR